MRLRIGCSGYHYSEWRGLFYPIGLEKDKWFDFYCRHFNSIELNVTFYKFPRVEILQSWYRKAPADFKFVVKAPRVITHFKKFKDAQKYIDDFYNAVQKGLEEKLGAVLFQFPSTFGFDQDKLERILRLLHPDVVNVIEFRNNSWWTESVYESFSQAQVAFCGMSHPGLPDTMIKTTDILYYRFHGVPHLYISSYDDLVLENFNNNLINVPGLTEAYVIFNNTMEGSAVANAQLLKKIAELVQRH